ncbi:hypothetical protein CBR_g49764 [Chara braunii]|uniref:Uncharacterized protein n=1 Tax=Chara braunii TaxID=69332 RepID=A0A388M5Q0_CHABU|nr:hypothetical protein CBR_g49764 [Chara braunii]|eukprot:GBG89914.1 hypothetical protein CBR_g49764 [Chara braunii]
MESLANDLEKSRFNVTISSQIHDHVLQESFPDEQKNPWKLTIRLKEFKQELPHVTAELNSAIEAKRRLINMFEQNFADFCRNLDSLQKQVGFPVSCEITEMEDCLEDVKEVLGSACSQESFCIPLVARASDKPTEESS